MFGAAQALTAQSSAARPGSARRLAALLALAGLLGSGSAARAQYAFPDNAPAADRTVFSYDSPLGRVEYVAGRGLRIGSMLTVGGFSTVEIDDAEDEPGTIELDGVNLLVLLEPIDTLRFFAELEFGDLLRYEPGADDVDSDPELDTERLYLEWSRSDALNVRLGKFQTPIGRWNLVPAEPFVWTSSDPVLVERAFDEHQTGAALFGSFYPGSRRVGYWLYGQFVDPLDPDRDSEYAERGVGTRVEYTGALENWSVGASYLASERKDEWSHLGGLDAVWRTGPLELTTELVAGGGDIPGRDLWGAYLQGVYDLGTAWRPLRNLYFVARYEHFDPRGARDDANLWDLGITWIPVDYLNLKAGYRLSDRQTDDVSDGLTASISVLF